MGIEGIIKHFPSSTEGRDEGKTPTLSNQSRWRIIQEINQSKLGKTQTQIVVVSSKRRSKNGSSYVLHQVQGEERTKDQKC